METTTSFANCVLTFTMFSKFAIILVINVLSCYAAPVIDNATERTNQVFDSSSLFKDLEEVVQGYAKNVPVIPTTRSLKKTQEEKQQDLEAHYSFSTKVEDNINGYSTDQVEERKNGKVYGRYSYDDSISYITRYYIADENGFRIVK